MKKNVLLFPAGAFAIGAAALFLYRRTKAGKNSAAAPKAAKAKPAAELKTAAYSFASGYKDAKVVEVKFDYDAEQFSYAVVSEDFIADTGDSHVGILRGEELALQVEYAAYYAGEDFAALSAHIAERFKGFERICCNGLEGIRYYDGKSLCLAFPAVGTDYVLINAFALGDDGDEGYLKLWDNGQLQSILSTLTVSF